MTEPIINPWIFYVIAALDGLKPACFLGVVGTLLVYACILDKTKWHDKHPVLVNSIVGIAVSLFALGAILIPTKETMYQMLIAYYVTPENVHMVGDVMKTGLQDIVKAIVEASTTIK